MCAKNISSVVAAFVNGEYNISTHGWAEMGNDQVTTELLEQAIGSNVPEAIEDYPDDERGPCCLILGWTADDNRPIHACIGYGGNKPLVITVYRPDLGSYDWNSEFRTRR